MGLLGPTKNCYGELCASSHITNEGQLFYGEEKEVGGWEGKTYSKQDSAAFHWLNPGQERSLPPAGLWV